jgi:hypothetical protein
MATDKVRKLADVIAQSALLWLCREVVSEYSFQGQWCVLVEVMRLLPKPRLKRFDHFLFHAFLISHPVWDFLVVRKQASALYDASVPLEQADLKATKV